MPALEQTLEWQRPFDPRRILDFLGKDYGTSDRIYWQQL